MLQEIYANCCDGFKYLRIGQISALFTFYDKNAKIGQPANRPKILQGSEVIKGGEVLQFVRSCKAA